MADQLWELTNVVPSNSFVQDWNETVERLYNRDVAKAQIEFRATYVRLHRKHKHRLRRLSEQLPQQDAEQIVAESFIKKVTAARRMCDEVIRSLAAIRDSRLLTNR